MMTPEMAEAQLRINKWNEKEILILNGETTDLDGEFIEIGGIDSKGEVVFHSLVKPYGEISEEATKIHEIRIEDLENSPTWPEVWEKLYPFLKEKTILCYNKDFYKEIFINSMEPYMERDEWYEYTGKVLDELDIECIMDTYSNLKNIRWPKLSDIVDEPLSHRAIEDARLILKIVRKEYRPEFTEKDWQFVKWYDEIQKISKEIQQNAGLVAVYQEKVEKNQEKLDRLLAWFEENWKNENPSDINKVIQEYEYDPFAGDDPVDLTDDDLPF